MAKILIFFLGISWVPTGMAQSFSDPYVRRLMLVGVIHVEGVQSAKKSIAVVRDRRSGRTLLLHRGDRILDADIEVTELAPQQITLVRRGQIFILRVDSQLEATSTFAGGNAMERTESDEEDISAEQFTTELPASIEIVPITNESLRALDASDKEFVPRFEPKPIQE